MENVSLTKDAKKAIAKIYKKYLDRKESGQSKGGAKYFDCYDNSQTEFINSALEDIPELNKIGFVKAYVTGSFELQDEAIIYMENLKLETIKEWLSFGAQFIP